MADFQKQKTGTFCAKTSGGNTEFPFQEQKALLGTSEGHLILTGFLSFDAAELPKP